MAWKWARILTVWATLFFGNPDAKTEENHPSDYQVSLIKAWVESTLLRENLAREYNKDELDKLEAEYNKLTPEALERQEKIFQYLWKYADFSKIPRREWQTDNQYKEIQDKSRIATEKILRIYIGELFNIPTEDTQKRFYKLLILAPAFSDTFWRDLDTAQKIIFPFLQDNKDFINDYAWLYSKINDKNTLAINFLHEENIKIQQECDRLKLWREDLIKKIKAKEIELAQNKKDDDELDKYKKELELLNSRLSELIELLNQWYKGKSVKM